jgi:hypothetical protein
MRTILAAMGYASSSVAREVWEGRSDDRLSGAQRDSGQGWRGQFFPSKFDQPVAGFLGICQGLEWTEREQDACFERLREDYIFATAAKG